MAVCRLCKTQIPEGEEYCSDCFNNNRAKFDESYLDSLLQSVNNSNNMILQPKKVVQDVNSDFTNMSNNNDLYAFEDKILLNRNKAQNITKQDEKILRDEFDKENEVNKTTEDDILSMLQDLEEDNSLTDDTDAVEDYLDPDEGIEMEDTDEDLLALLDMISAQDEANTVKNNSIALEESNNNAVSDSQYDESKVEQDVFSIEDLTSEINDASEEDLPKESSKPAGASDVGGIFSDVLSAVDTLSDKEEHELNIERPSTPVATGPAESKSEKKKSFWQRLFKKDKKKSAEDNTEGTANGAAKAVKKEEKKKKTERVKKKAEPKKAVKKVKAQKASEDKEEGTANNTKAKQKKEAKKKPVAKKPVAKFKKAKKEPKVKKAEAVVDPEDNIKINKLAVIFVMTFFILIGGFVIIGTDTYSYSLEIDNAKTDFSRRRYEEAYDSIYGLDIREKDKIIYDKIMTVMFVQKELNSYENYLDINMYPEALDSLLKGLERYDKHIKNAADLGIKSDLDYVKKLILSELEKQFSITETEAALLNDSEDQTQYSIKVINTVLEKGK